MIERKAYAKLLSWKQASQGTTALMIEGARRVGKTTLVKAFGAREYKSMLFIDFARTSSDVKQYFNDLTDSLDTLFMYLSARFATQLYERESLIVFDEVQRFPRAREIIKYLVADGRYDYIETGSLISIRENVDHIVIPSEEVPFALNPLDFEEFLWALGERPLCELIASSWVNMRPLPDDLHRKALRLFREYMMVGGMPSVVSTYMHGHDLAATDASKRAILDLYRRDISRFAKGYEYKVVSVFDQIPGQLSKHEKKLTLSTLDGDARSRTYEQAFFWLDDARISNPCYNVTDPDIDLRMTRDQTSAKLYMADTGLLLAHAFPRVSQSNDAYRDILLGKININEGMFVENAVAQTLRAKGEELLFHSRFNRDDAKKRMEIDFLVTRPYPNAGMKMRVCPVEVKSGTHYSTKSLEKFKMQYGSRVGTQYVVHPKPLQADGDRVYVPLYMAHLI